MVEENTFIIDIEIIRMMLGAQNLDDPRVETLFNGYQQKIRSLAELVLRSYFETKGVGQEQIERELQEFRANLEKGEEGMDGLFQDLELANIFAQKLNEYNKKVYEHYSKLMTPSLIEEANNYIERIQKEQEKAYMETYEEIDKELELWEKELKQELQEVNSQVISDLPDIDEITVDTTIPVTHGQNQQQHDKNPQVDQNGQSQNDLINQQQLGQVDTMNIPSQPPVAENTPMESV